MMVHTFNLNTQEAKALYHGSHREFKANQVYTHFQTLKNNRNNINPQK